MNLYYLKDSSNTLNSLSKSGKILIRTTSKLN